MNDDTEQQCWNEKLNVSGNINEAELIFIWFSPYWHDFLELFL